jgi:hypothetical protein
VKSGVRDEPPNLGTDDVIIPCLIRVEHNSGEDDRQVRSNGGLMIRLGKQKKLGEMPVPVSYLPLCGIQPKAPL